MFVQVNEACSHSVDITSSVPQGSKFGPLLFIVATKDVQTVQLSAGTSLTLYADDICMTKPLLTAASLGELEEDAENIISFSKRIGLNNNSDKNTYMVASLSNKANVEPPIRLGGVDVDAGDHIVHLGVIIDRALTFGKHVQAKATAARRKLGHIHASLRTYKLHSTIAHIYHSIIRPALTYSAVLIVGANDSNGETIARVDRLAARHATNKPRSTDATKLFADLGWTSVSVECRLQRLRLAHAWAHNRRPRPPGVTLRTDASDSRTARHRDAHQLAPLPASLTRVAKTCARRCICEYNVLPAAIRCIQNPAAFATLIANSATPNSNSNS
jgi:hypothetical protein